MSIACCCPFIFVLHSITYCTENKFHLALARLTDCLSLCIHQLHFEKPTAERKHNLKERTTSNVLSLMTKEPQISLMQPLTCAVGQTVCDGMRDDPLPAFLRDKGNGKDQALRPRSVFFIPMFPCCCIYVTNWDIIFWNWSSERACCSQQQGKRAAK